MAATREVEMGDRVRIGVLLDELGCLCRYLKGQNNGDIRGKKTRVLCGSLEGTRQRRKTSSILGSMLRNGTISTRVGKAFDHNSWLSYHIFVQSSSMFSSKHTVVHVSEECVARQSASQ
jgi:hypothetical protein